MTGDGQPVQVIRMQQQAHKGKVDLKHIEKEAAKENKELEDIAGDVPDKVVKTIEERMDQDADNVDPHIQAFIRGLPKALQALPATLLARVPENIRGRMLKFGLSKDVLISLPDDVIKDIPDTMLKGINIEEARREFKEALDNKDFEKLKQKPAEDIDKEHLVIHEDSKTVLVKSKDQGESDGDDDEEEDTVAPPKSMFKQLFPSEHRYTLLNKDEL